VSSNGTPGAPHASRGPKFGRFTRRAATMICRRTAALRNLIVCAFVYHAAAMSTKTLAAILLVLASCSHTSPSAIPPAGSAPPPAPPPSSAPSAAPSSAPSSAASANVDAADPLEKEARDIWGKDQHSDVVYVPTPQKVVDKMLEIAKVTSTDVVYDLGCGDGRIVVTAAKKGATTIGFDINPERVQEARANVKSGGLESLASIKWANVFSVDLSPATVVTMYLLPALNVRLIPQLEKLRPGSRIVSHDFDMKGVTPDKVVTITAPEFVSEEGYSAYKGEGVPEDVKHYKQRTHHIYLWTVPLKKVPAPPHS
jgi:SAM-dependent methyltransferase